MSNTAANHTEKLSDRLTQVRLFLQNNRLIIDELQHILALVKDICNIPISILLPPDSGPIIYSSPTEIELNLSDIEVNFLQQADNLSDNVILTNHPHNKAFNAHSTAFIASKFQFYTSTPLTTTDGLQIGYLCLLDYKENQLNDLQKRTLKSLAQQMVHMVESRMSEKELNQRLKELEEKNQSLSAIAQLQSHEVRQPFSSVLGLLNLADIDAIDMDKTWLKMVIDVAKIADTKIRSVVNEAMGKADIKLFRYNAMVGEIEDYAILLLDTQGNVENWNKGAEKIKGYKTNEIVGRNFSVFYSEEQQRQNLPHRLLEIARKTGVARDEGYRTRKDGTQFMARVVITAVHNENKEIVGFTKVTRDITNEKSPVKVSA